MPKLKRYIKERLLKDERTAKLHYLLKKNTKKVTGKSNRVEHSLAYLTKVTVDIEGSNNNIMIKRGARLINTTIFIKGSDHNLIIGEECTIKNSILP